MWNGGGVSEARGGGGRDVEGMTTALYLMGPDGDQGT